jgi:hypothetical protein
MQLHDLDGLDAARDMATARRESSSRSPRGARLLEEPKDLSSLRHRKLVPNAPQSQVAGASMAAMIVASSSGSEPAYG